MYFRGIVSALDNRSYRLYATGSSVSLVGFWLQRVGVGWLTWELTESGTWLGVMAMAVTDRIDSTASPMDDYERVDLQVRYQALSWLRPYVRAENAFGEDYEEVPGFETPGATFMVGVTLTR